MYVRHADVQTHMALYCAQDKYAQKPSVKKDTHLLTMMISAALFATRSVQVSSHAVMNASHSHGCAMKTLIATTVATNKSVLL
jgi:hypothetical protein